jgi:hypothetical protein
MNAETNRGLSVSFRPSLSVLSLLFLGQAAFAGAIASSAAVPCARVKSQPDSWVARKVDALVLAARAAYENEDAEPGFDRVIRGIAQTLRQCKLAQDQAFVSRHREFVEYIQVSHIAQLPDHKLGFMVPDKQYFEETSQYVQIPEFLLTQNFLQLASRDETLNQAKSFLQDLNSKRDSAEQLLFFSYRSQHLGTPDNDDSYERLLIVVPGNTEQGVREKWVQFGITDRRARARIRNLSVVSALANPDGTSNIYFKDFYRTYRRNGSISVNGRWELGHGDDKCVSCHKSGILPIFPESGSVSAREQQALQAVNQRFQAYGSPRFENYLDTSKLGPGLGAATEESRRRRFGPSFAGGFGGSTVGRAMTCNACHQPERLGSLNWPMDSILIQSYIKGGRMPLGHQLKAFERNELYGKLIREYFAIDDANPGILKSWLLGRREE